MHGRFELRWVLVLMLAVPGVTAGCMGQIGDSGGGTTSGSGGRPGSTTGGTGGTTAPGSGGSAAGGSTIDGTGGSNDTGTGGSASTGTGGSSTTATGGSTGTGGSTSAGTGGSSTTATGGSTGTGGSTSQGTGGAASTGGSGGTSPGTGGSGGASQSDAGIPPDPFSVAPTCTSGTTWKGGNEGSASMNPGQACISCHKSSGGEAPTFSVAGTLYPTAHEPDLCNGSTGSGSAQIVITGADGKALTLMPNSAGNFYSSTSVKLPYQAKVVYKGQERAMVETQSTGDCNSCHTQNGTNGAPGRILLP